MIMLRVVLAVAPPLKVVGSELISPKVTLYVVESLSVETAVSRSVVTGVMV